MGGHSLGGRSGAVQRSVVGAIKPWDGRAAPTLIHELITRGNHSITAATDGYMKNSVGVGVPCLITIAKADGAAPRLCGQAWSARSITLARSQRLKRQPKDVRAYAYITEDITTSSDRLPRDEDGYRASEAPPPASEDDSLGSANAHS